MSGYPLKRNQFYYGTLKLLTGMANDVVMIMLAQHSTWKAIFNMLLFYSVAGNFVFAHALRLL